MLLIPSGTITTREIGVSIVSNTLLGKECGNTAVEQEAFATIAALIGAPVLIVVKNGGLDVLLTRFKTERHRAL